MQSLCYYCMTPTMAGNTCTVCGRPPAPFSKETDAGILPPGTELDNGSIIVGAKIGRGGFGITYRALDKQSGKRVALKEFMPNHLVTRLADGKGIAVVAGNEDTYLSSRRSFMREANVLNELRKHPNIVKVLFTLEENNTVYYGMEFLEGDNIAVWARDHYPKKPMTAKDACGVMLPVMDALIFCHEKGVLHRDISPDNILICHDEQGNPNPKLIDFGAAHVAIADFTHTFPNVRKAYFSPLEQMSGNSNDQGTWSDVYSLCATVYYLITGRPPVSAIEVATGTGRLQPPSELGARIPENAEDVLMHGMVLDYQKRIQTVKAFRDEFCKALHVEIKEYEPPKHSDHGHAPVPKQEPEKKPDPVPPPVPEPAVDTGKQSPVPKPEDSDTTREEQIPREEKRIFIRAVIYLLLAGACYGVGYYFAGMTGLLYGWLAFSLILMISLLISGSTPGMAAAGLRFVDRDGSKNPGRMILYAFLNASPLGLLDGMLLFDDRNALCSRICGLKCVSKKPLKQEQERESAGQANPEPAARQEVTPETAARQETIPETAVRQEPEARQPAKPRHSETPRSASRPFAVMKGVDGPMKGRSLKIFDGDVLGRNPEKAQVVVGGEDATVGRAHCRFVYAKSKGKWGIVNLSSNGVVINGNRIVEKEGKPTVIPESATIQIGKSTYAFKGKQ